MRAHFDQRRYYTGDTVTLTVRITRCCNAFEDLEKIEMQVTRPQDGQGNWFVRLTKSVLRNWQRYLKA